MTSSSETTVRAADLGVRIQAEMSRRGFTRAEMALRQLRWMLLSDHELSSLAASHIEILAIATEAFCQAFDNYDGGSIAMPL